MEKVKEFFMKPLFWGMTVGHLTVTLLVAVASIVYVTKYKK